MARGPERPVAPAGALCQSAAAAGREPDCPAQGREAALGARKIRELLVRRLDGDVRVPAKSTIHAVLDRHGLVKRGGGPRHRARGTPLSEGAAPNDLWCADFKGEFKLGNGRYCYPLTVTDHASRFLLLCEARLWTPLPASKEDQHLDRARRSKARHQGGRRGHLARKLHALRSRLLDLEQKTLQPLDKPFGTRLSPMS
jgi:transposase InsO family protein